MPQPEASGADAHRQQTDGGSKVEVQTSTGGDDDPDDDDPDGPEDGGAQQAHGGDDDGGSLDGSLMSSKTLIIGLVVVSVVVLYFMYEGAKAEAQMGGGSGNPNRGSAEPAPEAGNSVPVDPDDPLKADDYVLQNSGIFPSIQHGTSGGPGDPAMGAN